MKLEIKATKEGYCEYFKIDGKKLGNGITNCTIFISGEGRPTVLIEAHPEEVIFDSENCALYLKKENVFKRIINKFKRGAK